MPPTSLWIDTSPAIPTDAFEWDGHYDTIIVGAGLTGLATALMLARSGLVIRESAPGIPVVGEISPEQVKQHMVAAALAAARGQRG